MLFIISASISTTLFAVFSAEKNPGENVQGSFYFSKASFFSVKLLLLLSIPLPLTLLVFSSIPFPQAQ